LGSEVPVFSAASERRAFGCLSALFQFRARRALLIRFKIVTPNPFTPLVMAALNEGLQEARIAMKIFSCWIEAGVLLALCGSTTFQVEANPIGGVASQGTAAFTTAGSQFTINTSDRAFINWQSFNIVAGETTTFVQPSSSSLVWNQIHDSNPSQILGNLNANGYVVLQNQSGFYIGGQAVLNSHGLLMTTAPIPAPSLSSGSAWSFGTPPPAAKIINYGQVNIANGGSAYLIASDIENNGTISAPGGRIGLYAGQRVLVSSSPDGRGLSAEVTLPEGSVDNEGHLIADGGNIALHAQVVNQDGLIQANSAQNRNGTIELVASEAINLGANSTVSASGDSTVTTSSTGGFVVLKSGGTFSDTLASTIDVSGGSGGLDGIVEIFGSGVSANTVASSIGNHYALLFNPVDITLSASPTDLSSSSPTFNASALSGYSQINLHAQDNIELSTPWVLGSSGVQATLGLTAGNSLTLDGSAAISAGNNWSVDLKAGAQLVSGSPPAPGQDGIYLKGSSYIQTKNGDISLFSPEEVIVNAGGVRTLTGGNIDVTTLYGDVNSGTSTSGFNYLSKAPYYTPFSVNIFGSISTASSLGGISTAGGGNVTINAGGNVASYLPTSSSSSVSGDPGTGAFGSQPGNVTITAGGSLFGHYVVVNGVGNINAGQDIGSTSLNAALSLVKGGWSLDAPNGNIYLQEVRNPNGVFNSIGSYGSGGNHLFDYDPLSFVDLTAGIGVFLTGQNLPRPNGGVPLLMPPTLDISAGSGGVVLQVPVAAPSGNTPVDLSQQDITLFPSANGNLRITTTDGGWLEGNGATVLMSDSAQNHWVPSDHTPPGPKPFTDTDHGSAPIELNNPDPVMINIAGTMDNIALKTSKATEITVRGDMTGSSFYGQNLHSGDATTIDVKGQILNPSSFNAVILDHGIQNVPSADLPPDTRNSWQTLLTIAVDPSKVASLDLSKVLSSQYAGYVNGLLLFGNSLQSSFAYNPKTLTLTFVGSMSPSVRDALDGPLTVLRYGPDGRPLVDPNIHHFITDTLSWAPLTKTKANSIDALYAISQGAPPLGNVSGAYVVGGPGEFDIHAGSLSLGNSYGILSVGNGKLLGVDYSYLAPYVTTTAKGASVNVIVDGDVEMPSSTIASFAGGNVSVTSLGGSMDLGSQYLVQFEAEIMLDNVGLGIYTSGGGNVNVNALGTINIDSSRIATFNGGNIIIESSQGDVDAGSGGNVSIPVNVFSPGANIRNQPFEYVFANGIVAQTLVNASQVAGSATVPGDITVKTPRGNIIANQGGILQEALNGSIAAGPTITLIAGSPGFSGGNIDLGNSGVIGGTVNITAGGKVTGLVISRQDSTVNAAQSFSGIVLSGGTANLSSAGAISGTIIGATGVNASGGGGVSATLLGQNVSVNGGSSQSTLGTATATATSQSAAGQASADAKEEVASSGVAGEDDEKKAKKHSLQHSSKRVTVILPKSG
jgi:filamentous hemagglutinin family protein